MSVSTNNPGPEGRSVTDRRYLQNQLDRLAGDGHRFLSRWQIDLSLREAVSGALLWLFAAPALVLVAQLLRLATGHAAWSISSWWLALSVLLGPVIYILARVGRAYATHRPRRRQALALYDTQLQNKDRLVTADDFLASPELQTDAHGARFMRAAVDDASEHALSALKFPLRPLPLPEWHIRRTSWLGVPAAMAAIFLAIFVANRLSPLQPDAEEQGVAGMQAAPAEKAGEDKRTELAKAERPPRVPQPEEPVAAGERTPTVAKMSPQKGKEEKELEGQSNTGQAADARSSSSASSTSGSSSNQKNSSTEKKQEEQKPEDPTTRTAKAKPKKKKNEQQQSQNMEANSGQGKSSASDSSISPFNMPEQPDKAGEGLPQDGEDEAAEDEDEQEKSTGVNTPLQNQRKPPVDRNLSMAPAGNKTDKNANGRGGPGARKKTRGVPSMILGVPVPDRVHGMVNAGRSKVVQENSKPKEESHPQLTAQQRLARNAAIGQVEHPDLLPWMQTLIEKYFMAVVERSDRIASAGNTAGASAGGEQSSGQDAAAQADSEE